MYRKEFEFKVLNGKNMPNFFLFFGDDKFGVDFFSSQFCEKIGCDNALRLYFEEWDFELALRHLGDAGLFGDQNLLRAKFDSKPNFKELGELVKICQKEKNNFFICEIYASLSAKEIEKDVKGVFGENFLRSFSPNNIGEAVELLSLVAKKQGIKAQNAALERIFRLQNDDLFLSVAELNKVAKLRGEVEIRGVEELVFSQNIITFEQFFSNLIKEVNFSPADLEFLDEQKSEVAVLKRLFGEFYRLFLVNTEARLNGVVDFRALLGYEPPQFVKNELLQNAKRFVVADFLRIFVALNEAEFDYLRGEFNLLAFMLEFKGALRR